MNSDAPYESAVQTSLIPLHGQKNWGLFPSQLWKVKGGAKLFCPQFFRIKFKKNTFLL